MGVGKLEHILEKMHAQHQPQAAELAVQIQELKSFVQSKFSRSFAGFVVRLCVSTHTHTHTHTHTQLHERAHLSHAPAAASMATEAPTRSKRVGAPRRAKGVSGGGRQAAGGGAQRGSKGEKVAGVAHGEKSTTRDAVTDPAEAARLKEEAELQAAYEEYVKSHTQPAGGADANRHGPRNSMQTPVSGASSLRLCEFRHELLSHDGDGAHHKIAAAGGAGGAGGGRPAARPPEEEAAKVVLTLADLLAPHFPAGMRLRALEVRRRLALPAARKEMRHSTCLCMYKDTHGAYAGRVRLCPREHQRRGVPKPARLAQRTRRAAIGARRSLGGGRQAASVVRPFRRCLHVCI